MHRITPRLLPALTVPFAAIAMHATAQQQNAMPFTTVSVLDFGASGDEITDNTRSIQAAIDHVISEGGGRVLIPPAEKPYLISRALTITGDNVTIQGPGATIKFKDASMRGDVIDCIEIAGTPDDPVESVSIIGLSIDANYWNQPGSYNPRAIDIDNASNITIQGVQIDRAFVGLTFGKGVHDCLAESVTISNWHNDAFNASGDGQTGACSNITFRNCTASNSRNGSQGGLPGVRNNAWEIEDGATDITLESCTVENAGGSGFVVRNHGAASAVLTSNITFTNCAARSVASYGFAAFGRPEPNTVSGITLIGCSAEEATFNKDVRDIFISNCSFSGEVVIGPTDDAVIEDSSIERLRVWATDPDGWTTYQTKVSLRRTSLGSPVSIHGPSERVSIER